MQAIIGVHLLARRDESKIEENQYQFYACNAVDRTNLRAHHPHPQMHPLQTLCSCACLIITIGITTLNFHARGISYSSGSSHTDILNHNQKPLKPPFCRISLASRNDSLAKAPLCHPTFAPIFAPGHSSNDCYYTSPRYPAVHQ